MHRVIESVENQSFTFDNGYTMKREEGYSPNRCPFNGKWVVRDAQGNYLDHSRYRHDLAELFNFDLGY